MSHLADSEHLLRAVLDDPFEDAPRLVYADVLEEAGDQVRAEFIRLECELAGLLAEGPVPSAEVGRWRRKQDRIAALHLRGRELLTAHYRAWFNGPWEWSLLADLTLGWPAEPYCLVNAVPGRGFVESVSCRLSDWCGGWERDDAGGGTGTRPAPGPAVALAQPVTAVTLADRMPYHNGAWYAWFRQSRRRPSESVPEAANIPGVLFKRLSRAIRGINRYKAYPTESAALAALSRAAVDWARAGAGLPALTRSAP